MCCIHMMSCIFVIYKGAKIMRNTNCSNHVDCAFLAVAAAVVAGVVAAIAQFTAIITLTTVFYIVAFGIAVLFLGLLLVSLPVLYKTACHACCNSNIKLTTVGILGTIVTSIILIAVGFAATSVLGAIFVGLLAAFFALIITSVVCIVNCASECKCNNEI